MNTHAPQPIRNALTVDVEDYFQVSAFDQAVARADWARLAGRVEGNVGRLLELFGQCGARATFFTLGWIAERYPALMRRIVAEGHELASHGYGHIRVGTQSRTEFDADVRRARAVIEDAAGVGLTGYRAASFSIGRETSWAFEVLAEAGFRYSSSVYPISHDHYGMREAPRVPYRPAVAPALIEIPLATVRFAGRNWPAAGGGYFRLLPYAVSRALLRRINERESRPANFYTHPWEIDPDQPRPSGLSARTRFRHYVNLSRTQARIARLLGDFQWAPMREVYADVIEAAVAPRCA